jgi:hypothetical protein
MKTKIGMGGRGFKKILKRCSIDLVFFPQKVEVLHYFYGPLWLYRKLFKPTLIVFHHEIKTIPSFGYAVLCAKNDSELIRERKVITNSPELTSLYLIKMGLDKEVECSYKPETTELSFYDKFCRFMYWD